MKPPKSPTGLLILIIFFGVSVEILAQDDPFRLPPNYIVNHYDIDLTIPAEAFTANSSDYYGSVGIRFEVIVSTPEVQLHSSYSNIELVFIQLDGTNPLTADKYSVDNTTDILKLNFDENLLVGQSYLLQINFKAKLMTSGGFYKTSYTDENEEIQYLASTQFQPTTARFAFPCFDEPIYKATFAYNLTHPSDMNALTNTDILDIILDATTNLTTTQFAKSPKMPVYLVAFIISKYTCTKGDLEGSDIKHYYVCSRQDKEYARKFSMSVTPLVIDHMNSFTNINYTINLSKLHQVAVAEKSGAMENWGLVLYSESGLLFDNTIQTNSIKQSIAVVISHEIAHQWFGNLVTLKWWSETFLNEGFATMFEYYTTNAVLPAFEMEKQFVIQALQPILKLDGNLDIPALRSNASTPDEISDKFDGLAYFKGASVLRMVEHILGREYFRAGLQKYLTDNAYDSVEPQDLWDALQNVTENVVTNFPVNTNLSVVVDNWINKGGYPVLNVSLVGNNIIISQQRFLFNGIDTEGSTWYVPVSYSTADIGDNNEVTTPRGWLTPTEDFVITGFSNPSAWIVVNNQQTGYYLVNYDSTLWNNLATALKQSKFSGINVLNRAQIVHDSYLLGRANLLSFGLVLKNVEFLANDTSYFTWCPAVDLFWFLLQKTGSSTELGAALTTHFSKLIDNAANSVPLTTVDEESHIYTLNQAQVNTYACIFGHSGCITAAKELFSTYKSTGQRPNINIRSIVYCNAIRYSDNPVEDWDYAYEQYQNSSITSDATIIWSALACTSDPKVVRKFLDKIITSDGVVKSSQYSSIFFSIYNNGGEVGIDTALDYFIENYQKLIDVYSTSGLYIGSALNGLGSVITNTNQIEKLENFINSTTGLSSDVIRPVQSAISMAKANQELINLHKASLYEYLGLSETTTSTASSTSTKSSTTTDENTLGKGVALGPLSVVGLLTVAIISSSM